MPGHGAADFIGNLQGNIVLLNIAVVIFLCVLLVRVDRERRVLAGEQIKLRIGRIKLVSALRKSLAIAEPPWPEGSTAFDRGVLHGMGRAWAILLAAIEDGDYDGSFSEHAWGDSIDINPRENPYAEPDP